MEEFVIISGNLGVQIMFGVYTVLLNGVFAAGVNPLFLTILGNLVTGVILLPFAVVCDKTKWPAKLSATLLSHFFLIALGGATLCQALNLVGIKKASPDVASAMPNLTPGLIFIIAACLRFEKFDASCWYSRAKVMGTLVCLTGTMAMCFLQSPSESPSSTINLSAALAKPLTLDKVIYKDWIVGCLCLLAGAISQSCTTVLQAATTLEFPAPTSLVVITSLMGSLLTALLQFLTEGNINAGSSTLSITSIAGVVSLIGVVAAIGITFQTWCIIKKGPVLVAIFSPIQTVTTVVLSAILLRQIITLGSLAGMVLMFAGLYIVLWAKKNEHCSLFDADGDENLPVEDVETPLLLS
ncbi:unnamed protein product [Musa acuminata subsp. malaccensis]|uniref:WAT1-related protein n=1 Tax=Musa acuminata subsp. malaccensis TaxID=214687 RepID=A0A804KLR0_MUSAM|nr:unnamed protein product [Musa acuminata subsp. malaccensis]